MSSLSGFASKPKTLSGLVPSTGGTDTFSDITVTGTITNPSFSLVQTDITSLKNKTQDISRTGTTTSVSNNLTVSGTLSNSAISSLQSKTTQQSYSPNVTTFSGDVTVNGTLTCSTTSGQGTDIVALQNKTQNQSAVSGTTTFAGVIQNGVNFKFAPDTKGVRTLTSCETLGTEIPDYRYFDFTWSGLNQNGYTAASSSNLSASYPAWRAFGTTSSYWASSNWYETSGAYAGFNPITVNSLTLYAEGIWALLPTGSLVIPKTASFTLKRLNNTVAKDMQFCGYTTEGWRTFYQYTNPTNSGSDVTVSLDIPFKDIPCTYFGLFITSVYPFSTGSASVGVSNFVVTGYNRVNNQQAYIPQCLEVGRPYALNQTIPYSTSLLVNGRTQLGITTTDWLYPKVIYSRVSSFMVQPIYPVTSIFGTYAGGGGGSFAYENRLPPEFEGNYGFIPYGSAMPSQMYGKFRAPIDGYYMVTLTARMVAGTDATLGLRPVIQSASYVTTNLVPYTDAALWVFSDNTASDRRQVTWSDVVPLYKGQFIFATTYSSGTAYWANQTVHLVSIL